MATGVEVSGDGVLLTAAGAPIDRITASGAVLTGHDALYAYPDTMQSSGTLSAGTGADAGLPRWNLADAATQRCKWVWAIPVGWSAVTVRWASVTAATGNVVWQFAYRYITLGEAAVDTGVDDTIAVGALPAGGVGNWQYNTPASTASIPVTPGVLGDAPFMLCSLSRLGADGADTAAGNVGVAVATITRV